MKTLEKINGKPVKEFWKEVDRKKPLTAAAPHFLLASPGVPPYSRG